MANRRMFSKTITSSSRFLMMPLSAQALYFQLGMNADDDGYVEHFSIMRLVGGNPDDLKLLAAKNFVHVFDDHVLIILDWEKQNKIQPSRKVPSDYIDIYPVSTKNRQIVDKESTQVRLGKVSIGKDSIEKHFVEQKDELYPVKGELTKKKDERTEELIDQIMLAWIEESGQTKISLKTKSYRTQIKGRIKELKSQGLKEESEIISAFEYVFKNKKLQADDDNYQRFTPHDWNLTTLTRPKNFMKYLHEPDYNADDDETYGGLLKPLEEC